MNTQEVLNNKSNQDRIKYGKLLIWAGFFLYVFVTGSKNLYTAELVTLEGVFNVGKAEISLAMTYYFISYAICQFLLLFLMSKLPLRAFICLSGALSGVCIILIGLTENLANPLTAIYIICAFNGIFTAGIYSGCMATFSKYLPAELLPLSNKVMGIASGVYTALAYGVPPLFVGKGLWNMPFIVCGIGVLLTALLFFYSFTKLKQFPTDSVEKMLEIEKPIFNLEKKGSIVGYLLFFMTINFIGNCLFYAVFNYIPSLMKEVFGMPDAYSILITLLVPITTSIISVMAVSSCYKHKNIFSVGFVYILVSVVAFIMLVLFYDKNIIFSLVLFVIALGFRMGANTSISNVLAFNMRSQMNSGAYLAAMNSVASLAAAIAPPIIGTLIDSYTNSTGYYISYWIALGLAVLYASFMLGLTIWYKKKRSDY